jgi:hypothetical protein
MAIHSGAHAVACLEGSSVSLLRWCRPSRGRPSHDVLLPVRPACSFFILECDARSARPSTSARCSPEDTVRRADHTASPWLDQAEGRLRLDRLRRNGGETSPKSAYAMALCSFISPVDQGILPEWTEKNHAANCLAARYSIVLSHSADHRAQGRRVRHRPDLWRTETSHGGVRGQVTGV